MTEKSVKQETLLISPNFPSALLELNPTPWVLSCGSASVPSFGDTHCWVSLPVKLAQVEGPSLTLNIYFVLQYVWDAVSGLASELPHWSQSHRFNKAPGAQLLVFTAVPTPS